MALSSEAIERCLELLTSEVRSHPGLSSEFEASIRTFFRGAAPAGGGPLDVLLAGRRHLEWFLVEQHSAGFPGLIVDHVGDAYASRVQSIADSDDNTEELVEALHGSLEALRKSHTGIFEVEEVRPGAGAWLRDVTGFGSFALASVGLSETLRGGELLVGRLYPAGEGVHVASPAAAIVRGPQVVSALQRDLERIRDAATSKVLRVSQGELEAMFFGAGGSEVRAGAPDPGHAQAAPSEDPIGDALHLLRGAGFGAERARRTVRLLAQEPRDPSKLIHGHSDVLARLLEEIAFDTDLDLDASRRALMSAWEAVSAPAETAQSAGAAAHREASDSEGPEDEVEAARLAAIESFAAARARGGDPAALVEDLERDLGLDPADAVDPDLPAPDFPGVVGAMIDEMRWELGATQSGFDVESLAPLSLFATFAKPIGVFEELRGRDLFQFATFWLQEKRALRSDDQAVALVGALRAFCEWALDAHEVDLGSEFMDALEGLEDSLPRTRRLNAAIVAPASDSETGELYEIQAISPTAAADFESSEDRVRSLGGESLTVILPDPLRVDLRPGDRIRATISLTAHAEVLCCYPPESSALAAR